MNNKQDKAKIYNSREWARLRDEKMRANPLCERCLAEGYVVSARVVHHVVPIETAHTFDEMWRLAIDCGLNGLQSLCFQCHSDIHKQMASRTKAGHHKAEADRLERWKARMRRPPRR